MTGVEEAHDDAHVAFKQPPQRMSLPFTGDNQSYCQIRRLIA